MLSAFPIATLWALILAIAATPLGSGAYALSGEAQSGDSAHSATSVASAVSAQAMEALAGFIQPSKTGTLVVDRLFFENTEEEDLEKTVVSRKQQEAGGASAGLNAKYAHHQLVDARYIPLARYRGEDFAAPTCLYIRFENYRL